MTGDERDEQRKLAEAQLTSLREFLDQLTDFDPARLFIRPRSRSQILEELAHVESCIARLAARGDLDWMDEIALANYRRQRDQLRLEDMETLVSHRLDVAIALDRETAIISCSCLGRIIATGPMKEAFEVALRHVEQRP
jgi:hypothetical protein